MFCIKMYIQTSLFYHCTFGWYTSYKNITKVFLAHCKCETATCCHVKYTVDIFQCFYTWVGHQDVYSLLIY